MLDGMDFILAYYNVILLIQHFLQQGRIFEGMYKALDEKQSYNFCLFRDCINLIVQIM